MDPVSIFKKTVKRYLLLSGIAAVLMSISFFWGRLYQQSRTGYHFEVKTNEVLPSALGPIYSSVGSESVGTPILNPDTTMITWNKRILYKGQREFQERGPFVQNIKIVNSDAAVSVAWEDGEFRYELRIAGGK